MSDAVRVVRPRLVRIASCLTDISVDVVKCSWAVIAIPHCCIPSKLCSLQLQNGISIKVRTPSDHLGMALPRSVRAASRGSYQVHDNVSPSIQDFMSRAIQYDSNGATANDTKVPPIQPDEIWTTDASNPKNWSPFRRWTIIVLLVASNMIAYAQSSPILTESKTRPEIIHERSSECAD